MGRWQDDLGESAFDFQRVVWPAISQWMGGGRVVPMEAVKYADELAKKLDAWAGIDAWQMCQQAGRMRGIASRVQWPPFFNRTNEPYNTFTVRTARESGNETEYAKRRFALMNPGDGWLLPAITVQAYVSKKRTGELLSVGVVRTSDLYAYIEENPEECIRRESNDGRTAHFIACSWQSMTLRGYSLFTIPEIAIPQSELDIMDTALNRESREDIDEEDEYTLHGFNSATEMLETDDEVDDYGLQRDGWPV